MKKRIFIDMDGVLCDFYGAAKKALQDNPKQQFPQSQWGFFLNLKPLPGAIESFKLLSEHFDVWVLTRPSYMNINCYSEKAYWIMENLGLEALKKTIMSCDKSIVKGSYLIDDQNNAKQSEFDGIWIKFGDDMCPNWRYTVKYIFENEGIEIS